MKKKVLSLLLAGALAMTALTACGGAVESTGTDTAAPQSDDGAASSDGKIKLVVPKVGYNEEQIAAANARDEGPTYEDKYYMAVTESIAKNYPEYDVEYVDWGWAETLDEKQRALFAAGSAPDIVAGETFMPTYANEGILETLPDDIVQSVNPTFLLHDADGNAVGVAYKTSIFLMFYNKDLLSAAGLDPENPPTTWEEWQQASAAITQSGDDVWGGGIPSFPHAGGALRATPFLRMLGTDFGVDGKINLTDPLVQQGLEYIREMNKNLPEGLGIGADESPMWSAFQETKNIGFVINGSWQASDATKNGVNWGVTELPTYDGTLGNCTVGSVYLGVPKKAANKEASFNLIREALRVENEKYWLEGSYCPAINEIIEDTSYYENDPALVIEMDAIKNGTFTGVAVFPKNDSAIWEIINQKVLARTTMTEDPIATICEEAQKEIEALQ